MRIQNPGRFRVLFLFCAVVFPLFILMICLSSFHKLQAAGEGYALEFDGVSDFVFFSEPLGQIIGTTWYQTKTISVWVKPTTSAPEVGTPILGDMIVGDHPRWFGIYWANSDGQDKIWILNYSTASPADASIGIPHSAGEWAFVTLWHDDTELRAYKNGVLVGSAATQPTALDHPGRDDGITLRIGGHIQGSNWETLFTGEIDEVRLWNSALTPAQIRQNMYRPLQGNEANLSAYFKMAQGTGMTLTDQTGNGWHGELIDGEPGSSYPPDGNTAVWITSTAFAEPRNALLFDGIDDYVTLNNNAQTVLGGSSWAASKTVELWLWQPPVTSSPTTADAASGLRIVGADNWGISQATINNADRLWVWNDDGSEDRIGIPYENSVWLHLALVHEDGTLRAYKNGALVGSVASGTTHTDGNITLGGVASGQYFKGAIDELRFWRYGRDHSEIQAQTALSQTLAYDQYGLTTYYRFDQYNASDQTSLYDTTVNNHHGTLVNMNSTIAWVPSGAFSHSSAEGIFYVYLPIILK